MSEQTPRIYVACLASYNAGILHGEWIELDGSEDVHERIEQILEASPEPNAEEWAVHDHEFCGQLSEYPGMDALNAIVEAFEDADRKGIEWEAFTEYCDHQGEDLNEESIRQFQENFAGAASSLVDWCEDFLEETGQLDAIPENLRFYFNTEAFARDMEVNDVFTIEHNHEVLVFWRH